ncbi:MobP3 family relaxase, partial [Flavonifractor plautii]
MSPYLKGGRDAAKLSNRARYIATRPGVEVLRGEHSNQPATKKQQAYIQRLLRDFPGAEELLEYEGYRNTPTQANADTFIRQVQEDFAEPMSRMENYLDYVSHRPGVQMDGEHGLWYTEGKVRNLSQAVREVAEHTGSVWMPVVAIRREDAERLGYNDAESWRQLVCACAPEIARGYKIPLEHLRWYAAFHRKEDSVHIHMVVFSSDPKEG